MSKLPVDRIIDCDIHHDWPDQEALYPYLSEGWREYVLAPTRAGLPAIPLIQTQVCPNPNGATQRPDAFPAGGGAAASDPDLVREQLLDPFRIERGLLTYGQGFFTGATPNPYFASEIARAANDYTVDHWLSGEDDRLYGTIMLAPAQPDVAVDEIRRLADHPRMAAAMIMSSGLGKPFGHPVYHPIYAAASELDLPVAIHIGGEAAPQQGISPLAGGMPSFYSEIIAHTPQSMMTHLASLILHGVFEKYPNLRVLAVETRLAWVPWFLWSLDTGYKGLRRETPWLKRPPSEYFYEHIRLTTQPLDTSPEPEQLIEILKMFNAQEMVCFSSDYPHWDGDERDHVEKQLPASWHARVFRENAREFFGWTDLPDPEPEPDRPAGVSA